MPITPLFAAIFGLFFIALSFSVIRARFAGQVSLGHAGNSELEKAIRVHGNFAEYVPFTLLLMWFVETISLSSSMVFWLGCLLLLSRVGHVIGISSPQKYFRLRQFGMLGTFSVILVCCVTLFWWYLPASL